MCVQACVCITKGGMETTGAWTKLAKGGLGKKEWLHLKTTSHNVSGVNWSYYLTPKPKQGCNVDFFMESTHKLKGMANITINSLYM